ncbi:hypothetical protein DFH11DRAFT_1823481 [Phellopilus nigrolimitatus]|nr:hypothetical protein DFH11DRAFT_1823481 [Phellopilus nigrolimitatus]
MDQIVSFNRATLFRNEGESDPGSVLSDDSRDDAGSVLTDESRSVYTQCSIVSSISLTQTISNNIGTGRTLDNYFYQPVGKAIEYGLSKVVAKTQIRRAGQIITDMMTSARLQIPDDGTHSNRQVVSRVPVQNLTDLLFIWGLRSNLHGWDEKTVADQCGVLASTMSHPSLSIKISAFEEILSLTRDYPRLCLFFDPSYIEQEYQAILHSSQSGLVLSYYGIEILNLFERDKTAKLLRRLSNSIPDTAISKDNFRYFRPCLLQFLTDTLVDLISLSSDPVSDNLQLISRLLNLKKLFHYDGLDLTAHDEPIVIFWETVSRRRGESLMFEMNILPGLESTWENARSSELISRSSVEKVEVLVRLSFRVIHQFDVMPFFLRPWKRINNARLTVQSISGLSEDRIEELWEEGYNGDTDLLNNYKEMTARFKFEISSK